MIIEHFRPFLSPLIRIQKIPESGSELLAEMYRFAVLGVGCPPAADPDHLPSSLRDTVRQQGQGAPRQPHHVQGKEHAGISQLLYTVVRASLLIRLGPVLHQSNVKIGLMIHIWNFILTC